MRKFVIQTNDADSCRAINSDSKFLKLNQSSPFHVIRWCFADLGNYTSVGSFKGGGELEIGWEPPPEPTCSSPTDCRDWPNSICKASGDGKKKCLCDMSSRWDGLKLNCTQGKNGIYSKESSVAVAFLLHWKKVKCCVYSFCILQKITGRKQIKLRLERFHRPLLLQ